MRLTKEQVIQQTNRYFELDDFRDTKTRDDFEEMEQIALRLIDYWRENQNVYMIGFLRK